MPIDRILPRGAAALLIGLAPVLALALPARPALAETSCNVNGAFSLNFGTVTSSGRAASSSESITCQPPYVAGQTNFYLVCIYMGLGGQPNGSTRRMTNYQGSYLSYGLYSDAGHTRGIGPYPGGPPLTPVAIAASGSTPQTVLAPVYGWVYPGQAVPATAPFYDYGLTGAMLYRFSTTSTPISTDCTSGGSGGGQFLGLGFTGISATFEESCVVDATNIDFGSVAAPQGALRENGNIRILCPPGTVWRVGLDNGRNYDGSMRRMAGAGGYVRYQLYLDQANTQVWGNDQKSMASGTTDNAGNAANLTVYGQTPAQPDARAGNYVDTIVVTLYY